MRIDHFEIRNFRKLFSVRIDVSRKTTLFVGANNSGKTSAMAALRLFLVNANLFSMNDFTLSNWQSINALGERLITLNDSAEAENPSIKDWGILLPSLDVWLHVENGEMHYVSKFIPTLDWQGGLIGVRLRLEPKNLENFQKEYISTKSVL